ncbi:hypothetical protein ACJJTC_009614 [Scirpophaga incertulas]
MKCAACEAHFNDGAFCGGCNRHLDFACANIAEIGYRRLGRERQASWRCPQCKITASKSGPSTPVRISPSTPVSVSKNPTHKMEGPSLASGISIESPKQNTPVMDTNYHTTGPVTLELLFQEIQCMNKKLSSLPTLISAVESIKNELSDLKLSCDFNSAKLDEFESRITNLEHQTKELNKMEILLRQTKQEVETLKCDNISRDQWARLNNIEIKGVPFNKNENLFLILESLFKTTGYPFSKDQVNYIARVPTHQPNTKNIIVSFLNRYVKDDFVAAARALIHVRKNDTSPVFIISTPSDLNRIV